jgi:hypothetical protein
MKTKVEIEGYEIEIEFQDGVISVKAEFEEEVVEEFTIQVGEEGQGQDEDSDDVQGFSEFGQDEEEDFDGEEFGQDDEEDLEGQGQFEEETPALESFQSFISKMKK